MATSSDQYAELAFGDRLASAHNVLRARRRIRQAAEFRLRGERQLAAIALRSAGEYRRAAVRQALRADYWALRAGQTA